MEVVLELGKDLLCELDRALEREWLLTNGLGGYASSTVLGTSTRRYHGLLVANLDEPSGRTLTLARLEEKVRVEGRDFALSTNEYHDGTIHPQGYHHLASFRLEEGLPEFSYELPGARLEKRIFMPQGENTTYILYRLSPDSQAMELELVPLCTYRSHHALTRGGDWRLSITSVPEGARIEAGPGAQPYFLLAGPATFAPGGDWYWRFHYREEAKRGLEHLEDLYAVGTFRATLPPGGVLTFAASLEADISLEGERALGEEMARRQSLLRESGGEGAPTWVKQLVLAADQFLVSSNRGKAIIAGYPWFEEWGRDTSISLPGLALATRRYELAREILRTQASFLSAGQIPNICPVFGAKSTFNAADSSFWYIYAVERYFAATQDEGFIAELYPMLAEIISCHERGVCEGVWMEGADGLLRAELPGLQLTWMDARVGGRPVTPRAGKAVEVNALWFNALKVMEAFAERLGQKGEAASFRRLAGKARQSFNQKFWYAEGGYLYDVVDGPEGDDASLRPNQVIALSLPYSPLPVPRRRQVLAVVERELLTPYGLRTLTPRDPRYHGRYQGDWPSRDAAYHQGTAWPWLLGQFVTAHYRLYHRKREARAFLSAFEEHIREAGVGTVSEIFDGDPPHHPGGAIAQAWSVGEVLRAWTEVRSAESL